MGYSERGINAKICYVSGVTNNRTVASTIIIESRRNGVDNDRDTDTPICAILSHRGMKKGTKGELEKKKKKERGGG